MGLAVIILFAVASSTTMSILAFMVGRCSRKLPIDGMLPRVLYSARFSVPFSSCVCLADLQDVDGLGQLPGPISPNVSPLRR